MTTTEECTRMSNDMILRRATDDDEEYLISCIRRSVESSVSEHEGRLSDLWIGAILDISTESLRKRSMCDETFVMEDSSGTYAGSLWLGVSVDQFTCEGTGYLLGIFVEPQYRRKGLGSHLLAHAERWCSEKGYLYLTLNVGWHNESARLFYESKGYSVRSEVRRKELL